MQQNNKKRRQLAALSGMIGSALFVTVFTIEGWLRPGYNPTGMFVSDLSMGPRGWIQITNFIVFGGLFLLFTYGVSLEFKSGKTSKAGPILLAIIGTCLFLSGPFVTDPASIPVAQMSLHGIIHQLLGAFVFLLAPISCFVFWRRFRIDPKWQSLKWWTLAAGIIIGTAVILLRIGTTPLVGANILNQWIGLIQRTALIAYLAWIFTFAWMLYKKTRS